jgi:hypothetical protein
VWGPDPQSEADDLGLIWPLSSGRRRHLQRRGRYGRLSDWQPAPSWPTQIIFHFSCDPGDDASRGLTFDMKEVQRRWGPVKAMSVAFGAGEAVAFGLIALIAWCSCTLA